MKQLSKWLLLGAGVLSTTALFVATTSAAPPPPPPKPATLVVGPATCKGATYTTINAAVAAAKAGDTIKVCAGNYPENVVVDKTLTFQGAQSGKEGKAPDRTNLAKESVVDSASGSDFTLTGAADKVTIDGFTISGVDADSTDLGINAFQGTSGLVVQNDVISGNCEGINLQNPDGTMPTTIQHNLFSNNTAGSATLGAQCGTAVFITNGPANNTTITQNNFTGQNSGQASINSPGTTGNPSVGLSVTHNISTNDSTFIVATNTVGETISQNEVDVTTPSANQGTAILDFGSNVDLSIDHNTIKGGSAAGTSGINIRASSGTASTNTTVTNNQISGRYNAIRLTDGASGDTVTQNHISGSLNDGIFMESGSGNTFSQNQLDTSTVHDCEDLTTGTGTAGTANAWTKDNQGKSNDSTPTSICAKH